MLEGYLSWPSLGAMNTVEISNGRLFTNAAAMALTWTRARP